MACALLAAGTGHTVACTPFLDIKLAHLEPTYLNPGEQTTWKLVLDERGAATEFAYAVTLTTDAFMFAQQSYSGPSFSWTGYGGATADVSYSTDFVNWTPGEPPDASVHPLYLRFFLPTLSGGQSLEVSYRTSMLAGPTGMIPMSFSATLACDVGQTNEASLPAVAFSAVGRNALPTRWITTAGGAAHLDDQVHAVALGADGHPVVAGDRMAAGGGTDMWIRRVDAETGAELSATVWTSPNGTFRHALAVAVDASGSVYVAGHEDRPGTLDDWIVLKYDATLSTLLAMQSYNGPDNTADVATSIAIDPAGRVVVAGGVTQPGTGMDQAVLVWDTDLAVLLAATIYAGAEPLGVDRVNGVAVAPDGAIITAGFETTAGGYSMFSARAYSGDLLGLKGYTYNETGDANGYNEWNTVAVDKSGFVYLGGKVTFSGQTDWYFAKYYAGLSGPMGGGSEPGPDGLDDDLRSLTVDADGNVIAVGWFASAVSGLDWRLEKRDNTSPGSLLFTHDHAGVFGYEDALLGAVPRGGATVFVAGYERMEVGQQDQIVGRLDVPPFSPPPVVQNVAATGTPGGALVTWDRPPDGSRPVIGYDLYRATYPGGLAESSHNIGSAFPETVTYFVDTGLQSGETVYYRVLAVDNANARGLLSTDAVAVVQCQQTLTRTLPLPEPLYAEAGLAQTWRIQFGNAGSATQYGVALLTEPGSFTELDYLGPSFSATRLGAGAVTPSWATSPAGPWTDGEPPTSTTNPLVLRFSVGAIAPGETGEVSWRTTMRAGPAGPAAVFVSATLSCDAAATLPATAGPGAPTFGLRTGPPLVWLRLAHDNPGANAEGAGVAVDASGNVYVAGWEDRSALGESFNWTVRKYDPGGSLVWTRSRNGPGSADDYAHAVAVDASGSVYVGGDINVPGLGYDWLLVKLDANGNDVWSRTYGGAATSNDQLFALAVDVAGNVLAAGTSDAGLGTGLDGLVLKYDGDGNLLWSQTVDGGGGPQTQEVHGVAADAAGNVAVVGFTQAGSEDWFVQKLAAADGALLWTAGYDDPFGGNDRAEAVAVDVHGNICVAGSARRDDLGEGDNIRVAKYDAQGGLKWERGGDGGGSGNDHAYGISTDAAGNIVVASEVDHSTLSQGLNQNWFKLDAGGNDQGGHFRDGVPSGSDALRAIAIIPASQDLVVAGSEEVPGEQLDLSLASYTAQVFLAPGAPGALTAGALPGAVGLSWAAASAGTRAVSGYAVYRQTFPGVASTVATRIAQVDGTNSFVDLGVTGGVPAYYRVEALDVAGAEGALSGEVFVVPLAACVPTVLVKVAPPVPLYAAPGQLQVWTISFENQGAMTVFGATLTTTGPTFTEQVYRAPSLSVSVTAGVLVLVSHATSLAGPWTSGEPTNLTGAPLYFRWAIDMLPPGASGEVSYATSPTAGPAVPLVTGVSATLSCDPAGELYALGALTATATGGRLAPPFDWLTVQDGPASGVNSALAIAACANSDVVVAGFEPRPDLSENLNWTVRRFSPTGAELWRTSLNGTASEDDEAHAICVTPAGEIVVGGSIHSSPSYRYMQLQAYDAAGNPLWTGSLTGASSNNDEVNGLAVDASGSLYVAGFLADTNLEDGDDWLVEKRDPSGNLLWRRSFTASNDQVAYAVAPDAEGNVVAVGMVPVSGQGANWHIRKYTGGGALLWTRSHSGPGLSADEALAVGTDAAGQIYVAGYETRNDVSEGRNQMLRKYDADGNVVWTRTINGPASGDDAFTGIVVTPAGTLAVAGYMDRSDAGQADNWTLLRFDNGGNLLSTDPHDGLDHGGDRLAAVAVTPAGSVVAAGDETRVGSSLDAAVVSLTPTAFVPPFLADGSTANPTAGQIALSWPPRTPGSRPVAGYRVYRQTFPGVRQVLSAFRTDVLGEFTTAFFDTSVLDDTTYYYRVLAVDDAGAESGLNAEVSATTPQGPCQTTLALNVRPAEPLYSTFPDQQTWRVSFSNWGVDTLYNVVLTTDPGSMNVRTYKGPSFSATLAGAAGVQPSYAASVGGPWTDGEPTDGTGTPLVLRWTIPSVAPDGKGEFSYRTALMGSGFFTVAVRVSATMSCDAGGTNAASLPFTATGEGGSVGNPVSWLRLADRSDPAPFDFDVAHGTAVYANSAIYTVGQSALHAFIEKRDSFGALQWTRTAGSDPSQSAAGQAVAVDGAGNAVIVGRDYMAATASFEWLVQKYDPAGNLLWSRTLAGPGGGTGTDVAQAVATTAGGDIVVAGRVGNGSFPDWQIVKYDAAGNELWATSYDDPTGASDDAAGVAIDSAGNILVAGTEERADLGLSFQWLVRKYASTGELIWSRTAGSAGAVADNLHGVAVDRNDNVLVTGRSYDPDGGAFDLAVRKYDGDGNVLWTRTLSAPFTSDDIGNAVTTDDEANVYVAGELDVNPSGSQTYDWVVAKYSSGGELRGSHQHDGFSHGSDEGLGLGRFTGTQAVVLVGIEDTVDRGADLAVALYQFNPFYGPGQPGAFNATGVPGGVQLGWTAASPGTNPVQGYRIYRATFAGVRPVEGQLLTVVPGPSSHFDSTGTPGEAYFYRVLALDSQGAESLISSEVSAVPQAPVAILTGALTISPAVSATGQLVTVSLTVTNVGLASATALVPSLEIVSGAPLVIFVGGPTPASLWDLPGGTGVTFVWTYLTNTLTGAGHVEFSATLAGADAASLAPVSVSATAGLDVTVATPGPAALTAGLRAQPATPQVGQNFLVTMTVTNTGGQAANAFTSLTMATSGPGIITVAGPSPAIGSVTIAPGAAQVFSWTCSGSTLGTYALSGTILGHDAVTSATVTGIAALASFTLQPPPVTTTLIAVLTLPAQSEPGMIFTVALTVTNTGANDADAVTPSLLATTGGGLIAPLTSPGGPLQVKAAQAQTFIWTFSATGIGPVTFSATAAGTDAVTTAPVSVSATGSLAIVPPAAFASTLVVSPYRTPVRRLVTVALTITNTGGADAAGVLANLVDNLGSTLLQDAKGPFPAGPVTIPAGAVQTFLWTYSVSGDAILSFTANAGGTDAVALTPVTDAASATGVTVSMAILSAGVTLSPAAPAVGDLVTIAFTVENTGAASATALVPSLLPPVGTTPVSGPQPGFILQLDPYSSTTFVWTVNLTGAGTITFAPTVTGFDTGPLSAGGPTPIAGGASASLIVAEPSTLSQQVLEQASNPIAPYPNPVQGGDTVNVAIKLPGFSRLITVDVYNSAFALLVHKEYTNVTLSDGGVAITGVRDWAPGVYLLRVTALCQPGQPPKVYPLTRVVVER